MTEIIERAHERLQPQSETSVAGVLARFAETLVLEDVPCAVRARAKHSILDAIGVGLAATGYEFASRAASAVTSLSGVADVPVIGLDLRLPFRDAALLNGYLIHGLDYDDTHLLSAVHPTASLLPTVLAVGFEHRRSGREILAAYIAGLEAVARLGMFGGIALREAGFHPTSVVGVFGCALAAGKLMGLDAPRLAAAQGVALAAASGTVGSAADGPSNKRLHPGWAAQAGITAAAFARAGVLGPELPYEGLQGLFRAVEPDPGARLAGLTRLTSNLGHVWEAGEVSVKPIPACHLTHACSDAAVRLRQAYDFEIADIEQVEALVPEGVVSAVCEPLALRRRPRTSHAAQFSIPYIVAASLVRGGFGLPELEAAAIADPEILSLAERVGYLVDPATTYPVHRTGELRVRLKDGRVLRHREAINRGAPDRPLSLDDIAAKFHSNAQLRVGAEQALRLEQTILGMEVEEDGRSLIVAMCAQ